MPRKATKKSWNSGRVIGPKPAFTPEQAQLVKGVLAQTSALRDQLLFAVAIDSCLRGDDLVQLRVSDMAVGGRALDVVRIMPGKTAKRGIKVAFEPSSSTKRLLERHIEAGELGSADYLFTATSGPATGLTPITTRAYLDLVKKWVAAIGLDPSVYGTHSIRRTLPAHVYRKTGNLRTCQLMLGQVSLASTQRYLGIEETEQLEITRAYRL